VNADPATNDPEVLKAVIEAEDWAFPVVFTDCDNPDEANTACEPLEKEFERPGIYTPLPLSEITQKWNICVSFPHLKDAYWVASNYGAVAESERDGLKMTLVEAGGYTNLAKQLSQLDNCVAEGAQAVIIGGISYDGLNAKLAEFKDQGVVVIDLINGMSEPTIDSHSLITYYKMGFKAGEYLCSLNQPGIKVGWFPGPPGAGWVETSDAGFKDAVAACPDNVEVLDTKFGDTGKDVQLGLVENTLEAFPDMNYIAGTAVTAEAAVGALEERGLTDSVKIVADYMIPTTYTFIQDGKIACAPTDQNPMQSRIAVDQAVRFLEGKPLVSGYGRERVEPYAELVCGPAAGDLNNLDAFVYGATFAPEGFSPTFTVG
jgi:protein TorT